LPSKISERQLLLLTGGFCFLFSSIADNITASLVCAALMTGDVTTLMIFLSGNVGVLISVLV